VGKLFSGGWLPLAVGIVFFILLTTWRHGRAAIADQLDEGRVTVRRFLNRVIDRQPTRTPGTAVFLSSSPEAVPQALLSNLEHNQVVPERVVLLTIETTNRPHVPAEESLQVERLRAGFWGVIARVGYQDNPDVPALLGQAPELGVDPAATSYYVNHVTLIPNGATGMAGWRKRLFAVLYRNANPAARYFNLPVDRVVEVGAHVRL
jgi:KUP system potassium uptake protein